MSATPQFTQPTRLRSAARIAFTGLASAALVAGAALTASAHVTVSPSETAAGERSILTFAFGHGCGTSATTQIAIQIPEEFSTATPTVNPGWQVEKVMATLDEPVSDGHGGERTERVDQIVYTANTPIPDGIRDTFDVSVTLPDASGETIAFPVVQTCEEGETAWVQIPEEGAAEPESPAPVVVLTEATGAGHGHDQDHDQNHGHGDDAEPVADTEAEVEPATEEDDTVTDETTAAANTTAAASDDSGSGLGTILGAAGLALGLVALLVAGSALRRSRQNA